MKNLSDRHSMRPVIFLNIVIVLLIVVLFVQYNSEYQATLRKQNVNDIVNINQSAANVSATFFEVQQDKLADIKKYAKSRNMTVEQLITYIEESKAGDKNVYELIDQEGKGFLLTGDREDLARELNYDRYNYESLYRIFANASDQGEEESDVISDFTPEFTDQYDACKSLGIYTCLELLDDNGDTHSYTLMSVSKTAEYLRVIDLQDGFDELLTTIIMENGDYILNDSGYVSTNFYQYLKTYNALSLDEQNEIAALVASENKGELYYKNNIGQPCIFVYTRVENTNWYCITGVPLASFHDYSYNYTYTIAVAFLLLLLLLLDVGAMQNINQELKHAARTAEMANEAKTEFLSRMSHDIRTPLNVISGMTHLALQEENPPQTKEYLEDIDSSGKFLTGLVNDILDLNKVESGKMELHLTRYTYSEFRRYINAVILPLCREKQITFTMSTEVEDRALMVDSLRFNQIFFNLLSNAVKFTPKGGHITFTNRAYDMGDGQMQLDYYVQDDGIGMSEEFQKHMFEAFSQESRGQTNEIHGTGLGLAIVYKMVKIMGGTVQVESRENRGTTFHVSMQAQLAPEAEVEEQQQARAGTLAGQRVLLCEDHPMNTIIAVKLLEQQEMLVETAENGKIGVDMFQASSPGYYAAILMDIRMPVMTGLEATRAIRSLSREDAKSVPIIAMTANAYDIDVQESKDAGMNAHLAKPIEPEKLYETLEIEIGKNK